MPRVFRVVIGIGLLGAVCAAQVVTATKLVNSDGNKKELLRKINGRWWTQDNREVNPPGKGGIFWVIDSKPGVVTFLHHRPFDLAKAETLHLFMKPEDVEPLLGQPNRMFGNPGHDFWTYYAANGTKVRVRFMDGVLGEAEYEPVGAPAYSVETLALELGDRSIYKVMAERAGQRSNERQAQWRAENRRDAEQRSAELRSRVASTRASRSGVTPSITTLQQVPVANNTPAAPEEKRVISREALAAVKIGAARAEVVAQLGVPSSHSAINGGEEVRETLTYHLSDGSPVEIRLVDGRVAKIP
jgi:hypothetical protein